jgi:hypothetical protein
MAVDRSEDSLPRKIPFAERQTRMEALKNALLGISVTGEHEPAHSLLDRACAIYETNSLKYLDLASCVSRALEVQGTTKNRELTLERGSLVMKNTDDKLQSATDSEIKVHYAMVRRGLTMQFAKLMSYAQHALWETFLFEALHRDPPPGYGRPTLAQLLQCDRAAFSRLASTLSSVRQHEDGSYPWVWLCLSCAVIQSSRSIWRLCLRQVGLQVQLHISLGNGAHSHMEIRRHQAKEKAVDQKEKPKESLDLRYPRS